MEGNGKVESLFESCPWYRETPTPLREWSEEKLVASVHWYFVLNNCLMMVPGEVIAGYRVEAIRLSEARQPAGWVLASLTASRGKKRYACYRAAENAPEALATLHRHVRSGKASWREIQPFSGSNGESTEEAPSIPRPSL